MRSSVPHSSAVRLLLPAVLALAGCPEVTTRPEPTITFLGTDLGVITSGQGPRGPVQGELRLTWQTRLADRIELYANGERVDFDPSECLIAIEGSTCTEDGTLTLRPTQDTTYELRALAGEGDCSLDPDLGTPRFPEQCAIEHTDIQVVPPATATLAADPATVAPGGSTTITYAVDAASWNVGLVEEVDGAPVLRPCLPASEDDGSAPCLLPEATDPAGNPIGPATAGSFVLEGLAETTQVAVVGVNEAEDQVGWIRLGDVEITIDVAAPPP